MSAPDLHAGSPSQSLGELAAAVDRYLNAVLAGAYEELSNADLLAETRALERLHRRLPVAEQRLVQILESRGLPSLLGSHGVSGLLQNLLRISPFEARSRVTAAKTLSPQTDEDGRVMEPAQPLVAAAQAEGKLSAEQIRSIAQSLDLLPGSATSEDRVWLEQELVDAAVRLRPRELGRFGRELLVELDPDGVMASDEEHHRLRSLSVTAHADGSYRIHGRLTPACGAQLHSWLSPRSAPDPAYDGTRDARTSGQRLHDALAELAGIALRRQELLDSGAPAQVIVTMTAAQFATGDGWARTSFGQLVSVPTALGLADEAILTLLARDAHGQVLGQGRLKRVATRAQTIALIARDRGCSFPQCDRPPEWTQRHHVIPWSEGGPTDIDNLTLLCGRHHRDFERSGWCCVMRDGLPWWIPPKWIDAEQKALLHHRIAAHAVRRPART